MNTACHGKAPDAKNNPQPFPNKAPLPTVGVRGLLKQKRTARRSRNSDRKEDEKTFPGTTHQEDSELSDFQADVTTCLLETSPRRTVLNQEKKSGESIIEAAFSEATIPEKRSFHFLPFFSQSRDTAPRGTDTELPNKSFCRNSPSDEIIKHPTK